MADLSHLPWDKVIESGVTVFGAVYAAYRGAISGHRKSENRLKGIEDGQNDLQTHLKRQDDHMARQDSTIETTLEHLNGHTVKFSEHVDKDEVQFQAIKKQVSALGRRISAKKAKATDV